MMDSNANSLASEADRHQIESPVDARIADRLGREARALLVSAPPGLHGQVMEAVRRGSAVGTANRERGQGWLYFLSLSGAATVAAVLVLLAVWKPLEDLSQASIHGEGTGEGPVFSIAAWTGLMDTPERAEAPIHEAAAQTFLAEYERLGKDLSYARNFLRSTTRGWGSQEFAAD
jgi:hypothetical protein